jgi:hypothetical protein
MLRQFTEKPYVQGYMQFDGTNLAEFQSYNWTRNYYAFTFELTNNGDLQIYSHGNPQGTMTAGQWFSWGTVTDDIDFVLNDPYQQEVSETDARYVLEES